MTGELWILFAGLPIGYAIAHMCRDELKDGRKWFLILMILGLIGTIISGIFAQKTISLTLDFIAIVSMVSFAKSFDKNWIAKKF